MDVGDSDMEMSISDDEGDKFPININAISIKINILV